MIVFATSIALSVLNHGIFARTDFPVVALQLATTCIIVIGMIRDQRSGIGRPFRENGGYYKALYHSMPEGIAIFELIRDGEGDVVDYVLLDANPTHEAITGLRGEESIGLEGSVLHGSYHPQFLEAFVAVAKSGEPNLFETHLESTDKLVIITAFPLQGDLIASHVTDVLGHKLPDIPSRTGRDHYRTLFENSPIALVEEDWSEAKDYIERLRSSGITDLQTYFADHPEFVGYCSDLMTAIDVNRAAMELFDVSEKQDFLDQASRILENRLTETAGGALIALAHGQRFYETEIGLRTSSGISKAIAMKLNIIPGHEETLGRVLVSMLDITGQKSVAKALNRQLGEQSALHSLVMAGAKATSIDSLIDRATLAIGTTLYPDNFGVMLANNGGDSISLHKSYRGIPEESQTHKRPLGTDVASLVVATCKPCRIPDVTVDPAHQVVSASTRSLLCIPLKVGAKVFGVINVESRRRAAFTEDDERLMMIFAGQLAVAIERVQLLEADRRRVEELEALRATMTSITGELESSKLPDIIVERAVSLLGATGGELGLYDKSSREILIVSSNNAGEDHTDTRLASGEDVMGRTAESCVPLLLPDYQTWKARSPNRKETPWHAVLAAPLVAGRHLMGVISVGDADPDRRFTTSDVYLLNMFAQQAAIAIENARLFRELQELAVTDALTGLNNRRHFFEIAEREIDRSIRYKRFLAVLMLDIDHYKEVNDTYGHITGDQVLRVLADRCKEKLRASDVVGRFGGDEFAVLLPETGHAGATMVAEKLRESIADSAITTDQTLITITISVGVAYLDATCASLDQLLERADQALYSAKQTGRNRVCIWTAQSNSNGIGRRNGGDQAP